MAKRSDHCKKCDQPVYVNEEGFAGQKPYISALCVGHLYEAFAALEVLPPMIHTAKDSDTEERSQDLADHG